MAPATTNKMKFAPVCIITYPDLIELQNAPLIFSLWWQYEQLEDRVDKWRLS